MGSLRWALVLVATLATTSTGCETSGIQVDIVMPTDGPAPDHIRLFVGVPTEDDAAMIGPEAFGLARPGSRWLRDPMDYDDLIEVKPGAELSFGFLSEKDHQELGAIIAVGYTDTMPTSAGSLFHTKAGVGVVRVFKLQLFAAADARDKLNRTKNVQIELWGPEDGEETCVHLYNKHPERDMTDPHDSAFIVLGDDNRDCDRWHDDDPLECAENIHENNSPPRPFELNCTYDSAASNGHCFLGGPACIDGVETGTACAASNYCAPASVCTLCQQLLTFNERRDCVRAPTKFAGAATPTMAAIKCHVGTYADAANGQLKMCAQAPTLRLPIPTRADPLVCSNAMISRIGEPLGSHIQIENMRFDVDVDDLCVLTLTPIGEPAPTVTALPLPNVYGMVTAELDNARALAMPLLIVINPPDDCVAPIDCAVIGEVADRPNACTGVPKPMPPP